MFGMEDLVEKNTNETLNKSMAKIAMSEMIGKEASDHFHIDSEGKATSPSKHEDDEEKNPHNHNLKGGGETDIKESEKPHKHKELDEDGGETGPAIKTAFKKGFIKNIK